MRRMSPLTARYNGFMLGHFLALASFRSMRPRYSVLRRRINAFLDEVGVPGRLPFLVTSYQEDALGRTLALLEALRDRSGECASTAWLSACVILRARGLRAIRYADLMAAGEQLDIDPMHVRRYAKAIPHGRATIAELLAPAMAFLQTMVTNLRRESRTCFVAMPFRAPFERQYATFYTPALYELGYRSLRAWGGVGMEDYLEVVLALIARSGACLADVTRRNPNVLYELGAAQGLGRKCFIVTAEPAEKLPANVSQHTALRFHYDPGAKNWPNAEIWRFVGQTALAEFALAQGE